MPPHRITTGYRGLRFVWHGGEYIEVCIGETAIDVINVWDYDKSAPTIPASGQTKREAVRQEAREWYAENHEYLDDLRMAAGL